MESPNIPAGIETEHFNFGTSAADVRISKGGVRNLRNEITNKGFEPEAVIDAFEAAKGIKPRKRTDAHDYTFKNIILDPEQQKDQDMLNTLMNDKNYVIALWKDTWTMQGSYRVFVIYGSRKEKTAEEKQAT